MHRLFLATSMMVGLNTAATAGPDYSNLIATQGLSGAQSALQSQSVLTPSDQFALGGVRFLGAIEHTLQTRYRAGIFDGFEQMTDIPFLRLPIPENPTPEAFAAEMISDLFETVLADMEQARQALDTISASDEVSVVIDPQDLWFDINMNDRRDPGEGLFETAGAFFGGSPSPLETLAPIQFDLADAAWLSAYSHLLSGVSETILAFDPAAAIKTVFSAGTAMDAARAGPLDGQGFLVNQDTPALADLFATIIYALESQPDVTRSRAAHAHFLDMINDNKEFWSRVALETDNDAEWIPNARQTSVLPVPFPAETGERWQNVLMDAEALLNGDLLLPHWRLGDNAGINLGAMFQNPPPIDIAGVVQGWSVMPYVEQGRLIDAANLRAFEQLVGASTPLYMIILN